MRIIMPVYIDDIILASKNTTLLNQTVLDLSKHFKLRDLGETKFLLGVEIIRDQTNRTISLSQRQYIVDMLERYSMAKCNAVGTPLAPETKLPKSMCPQTQEEIDYMRSVPYLMCSWLPQLSLHHDTPRHLLCCWLPWSIQLQPRTSPLGFSQASLSLFEGKHGLQAHLQWQEHFCCL